MTAGSRKWTIVMAGVVFAVGLIVGIYGVYRLRDKLDLVGSQELLIMRLNSLEKQRDAIVKAKANLKTLESRTPSDLDGILRSAGLLEKVSESHDAVTSLGEGWSVLTRELSLSDVVLTDLDSFVVDCQSVRPPWVLTKAVLRSSPFESGRGQAVITMQALRGKQE